MSFKSLFQYRLIHFELMMQDHLIMKRLVSIMVLPLPFDVFVMLIESNIIHISSYKCTENMQCAWKTEQYFGTWKCSFTSSFEITNLYVILINSNPFIFIQKCLLVLYYMYIIAHLVLLNMVGSRRGAQSMDNLTCWN
jgi:hypothetical protein